MKLFDFFVKLIKITNSSSNTLKTENSTPRTLKTEDFYVVGTNYHKNDISKLAVVNKDYQCSAKKLINEGKAMKKIFQYSFINKPIKLIPEPENVHDRNAIKVVIAGEHVGYISSEKCLYVKEILKKNDIKYITAFISGGKYKVVSLNGSTEKFERTITINIRIAYV